MAKDFDCVVCFLLGNSPASEFYMLMFRNNMSVLKRRHIKFRRRGITQKKAYSIQNTVKVWNQGFWLCLSTVSLRPPQTVNLCSKWYIYWFCFVCILYVIWWWVGQILLERFVRWIEFLSDWWIELHLLTLVMYLMLGDSQTIWSYLTNSVLLTLSVQCVADVEQ